MSYFAPNLPRAQHCFFGRRGGVSQGLYDSLNINGKSNDNHDSVLRNLDIIAGYYGLARSNLLLINQGVSGRAEFTDRLSQNQITADGIVTGQKDFILCIGTADCAPVLFLDAENSIVGAAHAGWRGALRGIVENTLETMLEHGAATAHISAAVGPCLQQPSFETGTDMYQEFLDTDPQNARYFVPGRDEQHFQFDLEGFVVDKLKKCGLQNVTASGIDTYAAEAEYFSYRRNTHRKLVSSPKDFPAHLSTIKL